MSRRLSLVALGLMLLAAVAVGRTEQARGAAYTWNVPTGNWNAAGSWTPAGVPTTGDTGTIGTGIATINAALTGSPSITITGSGIARWNTLAGPVTAGTIIVGSGGILQFDGNTTNPTAIQLDNGARVGKFTPWTSTTTSNDNFTLTSGATVTFDAIRSHVPQENTYRFQLSGQLSGVAGTTIQVKPGLYTAPSATTGSQGELRIAPSAANPFAGLVEV